MSAKKFIILTLFSVLVMAAVSAQQPVDVLHEYPFIRYEANRLHYDSSAPHLQHFFNKWNRVVASGQGNVNIVHIGSSHVQGGTLPNRVRVNLMGDYPDLVADRGMLFPYSAAAKCNNPPDYVVHCPERVELTRNVHAEPAHPLGLCGIAVTAHDTPTHIDIVLRRSHIDYATRQVIVLGYPEKKVVPLLAYAGRTVAPSYVDPPTRRYVFNLAEATDSFQVVLPCEQGDDFTLTGIYLGNRQSGFSYHSIGVNGASLADYQKCGQLVSDLRLLHPDMVIFGIGINDASGPNFDTAVFRQRYLDLIDSVRLVNPSCAFLFITNNDSYRTIGTGKKKKRSVNPNGVLAREVFYRLAEETGGAVWDQFEIMGGLKSMDRWVKNGLAQRDHVHFTPTGYNLLGDLLYNALIEAKNWETRPREGAKNGGSSTVPTNNNTQLNTDNKDSNAAFRYISY